MICFDFKKEAYNCVARKKIFLPLVFIRDFNALNALHHQITEAINYSGDSNDF